MDHCLRSRHYVNVVIAGNHPASQRRMTQALKKKEVPKTMAEADPSMTILLSFHNPQ